MGRGDPARRKKKSFSVALCDIDNFKQVNDSLGHAAGDRVLKIVAGLLEACTRDQDVVARYGGEEFIAMLPDTSPTTALAICERMRRAIADYDWSSIAPDLRVTISMGLASDPHVTHHEKLISIADDHLYQAKAAGKNRVVGDPPASSAAAEPGADAPMPRAPRKIRAGMPSGADAPPAGFTLRRRGESLETVTTRVGAIALLASQPHLEVTEGTLDKDGRMTLVPDLAKAGAPELYYLLEGTLTCDLPNESLEILPGDHLLVQALEQPLILTATRGARFLYVSPEPSFHQISHELDELRRLAVGVEFADGYTAEHCGRLQATAYAIGEALDLPKHRLHLLDYAAYLHDVGKTKVPKRLLTSPDALDEEGWTVIRRHPVDGAEMLAHTFMADAAPIVAQHHERLDGSGYPYGLSGDEILLESHIVAVADTFDAMTSDRPYRPALSREAALDELRRLSGRSFPREVVEALEQVLPQLDI